jgi:hypothetical protein
LPTFLLATGGLVFAPTLTRWWIDLANAASAALLDPASGLPGLAEVQGFDRLSALGVLAIVYLTIALLLLLHRLKLVVLAALLLTVAPLAIAAGALPFALAQRFFRWWLATFLAVTFVQVLQAGCLGLVQRGSSYQVVRGAAVEVALWRAAVRCGPKRGERGARR